MAQDDYDHLFRLLIVGAGAVGKSSLFSRFTEDFWTGLMIATAMVDFRTRMVDMNGERVKLQIFDTPGVSRLRSVTSQYFKYADGVIVVYDVMDRRSFEDVEWFLNQIPQNCGNACRILVGNKNDQRSGKKEVGTREAVEFGESVGIRVFETSARENIGVEEMFYEFVHMLLEAKFQSQYQASSKRRT